MGYSVPFMQMTLSKENVLKVNVNHVPRHVAIIMDGNRRWAKRYCMPAVVGHWKGAETLTKIVESASNLGIKVLTVFAFSTENWTRPLEEVDGLMELFKMYLIGQRNRMVDEGVRLDVIGNLSKLPLDVRHVLEETKKMTAKGSKIDLVLAINYGARDDIRRAAIALIEECEKGKLRKEEISEQVFSRYLDTAKWGDPDLLIRTSGEKRLSNFLLWQISYAEVYITEVLWPDFTEEELLNAIMEYQRRDRRSGG